MGDGAISTDDDNVRPDLPSRPAREDGVDDDRDYRRRDRRDFNLGGRGSQDVEHLRVLSICFYVYGALLALGGLFPLIYVVFGALIIGGFMNDPGGDLLGWMLICIPGGVSMFIWGLAGCTFFVGNSLSQRKRYLFCFIVACLCCLQIWPIPLGIILGIFTIIVLARPSVKELFAAAPAARPDSEE